MFNYCHNIAAHKPLILFFVTDKLSNYLFSYYYISANGSNDATIITLAAILIAAAPEEIDVAVKRKVHVER